MIERLVLTVIFVKLFTKCGDYTRFSANLFFLLINSFPDKNANEDTERTYGNAGGGYKGPS